MKGLPVDSENRRPIAWQSGARAISRATALAQMRSLSQQIQAGQQYLNLCEDRYLFTVAFVAVCMAGGTNLLPQSNTEEALARIRDAYPGCAAISDTDVRERARSDSEGPPGFEGIDAGHLAAIAFTSGSTGLPRPNVKRWGDLRLGAALAQQRFFAGLPTLSIVATVPIQHMYGLETTLLTTLFGGHAAWSGRPFTPRDVREALEAVPAPRVLVSTPLHLRAFLRADIALPPVHSIISATAPMGPELAAHAEAKWQTQVFEIYGCTEAGSLASRRTTHDERWELYDGMQLSPTANGRMRLTGLQMPEPVVLDDDLELAGVKHFLLRGRSQDMIKVGGKRISAGEMTRHLQSIDGVEDAAVWVPDATAIDARPVAFVVTATRDSAAIGRELRLRVDPVFVPRPIICLSSLPRNAVGKLPKAQMEALLRAYLTRGAAANG